MDPLSMQHTRQAFSQLAQLCHTESPLVAGMASDLGRAPSSTLVQLLDRYCRITSMIRPDMRMLIAALHYLALNGQAPELRRFFPSCGGGQEATDDSERLAAAVNIALCRCNEEILDFMISEEPHVVEIKHCIGLLMGALATADRFGGGISVVQLGAKCGLHLLFDQYSYRIGDHSRNQSPVLLQTALDGNAALALQLLRQAPPVVGRWGLDNNPIDPTDPAQILRLAAFIWPDRAGQVQRLLAAATHASTRAMVCVHQGDPAVDAQPLLVEAYNTMKPGNTLFLFDLLLWSRLSETERKQLAWSIQRLAAQIEPHKPLAWLQLDRFTPGQEKLELRLHTFGWTDQEERDVRLLAEADHEFQSVRWLE